MHSVGQTSSDEFGYENNVMRLLYAPKYGYYRVKFADEQTVKAV